MNNGILRTPCAVDIEITNLCNHSCRYCYNFWRHESAFKGLSMSKPDLDLIIGELIKNKVFNVVLTGGEPFLNYDVLLHGVKRLTQAGILVSCNSNLTLATKKQLKELKEAGLPHILTSLASFDPEINDRIFNKKGSFVRIVSNIRNAVEIGFRISVNTVISKYSKDHVYKTGLLISALGAKNIFLTRVVPCSSCKEEIASEFILKPEEYLPILDDALRVKRETGINIGSLIQYPVCFLKDVNKYSDFLGRGCPAGKKMVCINANGDAHACFHEKQPYGNIFKDSLQSIWGKMKMWRDESLIPDICRKCSWLALCEGGCRVYAKNLKSPDFLCLGNGRGTPKPVKEKINKENISLPAKIKLRVKPDLRFREEDGFWLIHTVGASITQVSPSNARFLIDKYHNKIEFRLKDFPGKRASIEELINRKIVEVVDRS